MDQMFEWKSPYGDFDITPDPDCMMVYVESHRNTDVPKMQPREIPSWFFEPDTIWFHFGAADAEDKVTAGSRIKQKLLQELGRV
jgi:hypothetical protein